jgi:hypothetical protein
MKIITLLFVIFFSVLTNTFACSCASRPPFFKVAPSANLVALVKIVKFSTFKDIYNEQTPMSMEVEIIETYKGKTTSKIITVWGDNGMLCRPYLSLFVEGNYYVIAFFKGEDGTKGWTHPDEKATDYAISICGEYWLNVDIKEQTAKGNSIDTPSLLTLDKIRKKLRYSKNK